MLRHRTLAGLVVAALVAGCGVRAPAPIDTQELVRRAGADGAAGARGRLELRILDAPRDVQARLALAKLADETGRPSQALEQLEAVRRLGGPLGTRWHDDDRARMARLLAARGRVRLAREAPTALPDLERARAFGASVTDEELLRARRAIAIGALRHVDAKERERGRNMLLALIGTPVAHPSWIGAKPDPVPRDRGLYGVWLWEQGARRAAWEALASWRAASPERGGPLHAAYLRAYAWWHPLDAPPPPAEHLIGPERCWFAIAACDPPRDEDGAATTASTGDRAPEGPATLPPVPDAVPAARTSPPSEHGTDHGTDHGAAPVPDPPAAGSAERQDVVADPGAAIAAYVRAHTPGGFARTGTTSIEDIVAAYRRDPAIADRLASDLVAEATDAAAAHAALGTLFDVVGDPARARAAWEAAVASSAEPRFVRGLAVALARAGDPDASLIHATTAAAASGDPASVWIEVSRALDGPLGHAQAMEAARYALELAGADTIADALDAAIAASESLGRTAQADRLRARRAALSPARPSPIDTMIDTTIDTMVATVEDLWSASRANPRDVPARAALRRALSDDDPRRSVIDAELVALAGGPDPRIARAAVLALR